MENFVAFTKDIGEKSTWNYFARWQIFLQFAVYPFDLEIFFASDKKIACLRKTVAMKIAMI